MEKISEEAVLQAIRDSLVVDACSWAMWNYIGGKQQIAEVSDRHADALVSQVCHRMKNYPASTIRAWVKKIAPAFGMTLHQYRKGASIRIITTKEHSAELKVMAEKWWELMGYSKEEARPTVDGHRLPASEAELRRLVGDSDER